MPQGIPMTYYLYIPFKKKDVSERQKKLIEHWVTVANERRENIEICFSGDKKLSHLPSFSKIYILLLGKAGPMSPLAAMADIPTELARGFESFSRHLKLNDGKHSLLVPEVADQMIADGLLNGFNRYVHINLFFYDEDEKTAMNLTKAFLNSLVKKPVKNCNIRLDYYADNAASDSQNNTQHDASKKAQSKSEQFLEQVNQPKHSLYNNATTGPKLTADQISLAIKQYYEYKSLRCCGLSGLLNLNGFFSSDESAKAITYLSGSDLSQEICFDFAAKFLKNYPNNQLSHILNPILDESLKYNQLFWTGHDSLTPPQLAC